MKLAVRLASPVDDEGVRRLVRTQVLPGRVRLAFWREPVFSTGCAVTGDGHSILVAQCAESHEVVGVACRSFRRVFLNGREQRIGYLGQLRIHERYRGRWLLARGFALLEQMHREDPVPAYLTSIVAGNDEATGVLVHRARRAFPVFREAARYVTLALRIRRSFGRRASAASNVAAPESLEEVAAFLSSEGSRRQLSSVWTAETLGRLSAFGLHTEDIRVARTAGAVRGVMALWDQTAYKQAVIRGYSGWLRAAAPLLPRPGTQLHGAYASLVCVADDDLDTFRSLLREICALAARHGFHYLLLGLDVRDPLLRAVRGYFSVAYPSRLYLASWPDGGPSYEPLDARPAYVDIATL